MNFDQYIEDTKANGTVAYSFQKRRHVPGLPIDGFLELKISGQNFKQIKDIIKNSNSFSYSDKKWISKKY